MHCKLIGSVGAGSCETRWEKSQRSTNRYRDGRRGKGGGGLYLYLILQVKGNYNLGGLIFSNSKYIPNTIQQSPPLRYFLGEFVLFTIFVQYIIFHNFKFTNIFFLYK